METPDASTLRRLYVDEKKSLAEIGRLYEVHRNQVRRWLLRAAIPTRSIGEANALTAGRRHMTEEHIAKLRANAAVARSKITEESRKKQAQAQIGRTPWNKGKPWSDEVKAKFRERRSTDEYRRAASERQRGENGPNWQGGVSKPRSPQDWEWRKRRAECYERDNWTCRDCGVKCGSKGPRRIQAHHVIPRRNGGGDELENLLTLCASCHHKREARGYGALFA
jgi:5-methylcytosine-specific restriction endonuclease McrA